MEQIICTDDIGLITIPAGVHKRTIDPTEEIKSLKAIAEVGLLIATFELDPKYFEKNVK